MLDILIKNALIYDGTGAEPYSADIGIKGEHITEIGEIAEDAAKVIDATGKVVTPGFIDPHCHVDTTIIWAPEMEPYLKQGVTTVIGGNCGHAIAPMGKEVFRGPLLDIKLANAIHPNYFEENPLMFSRKDADEVFRRECGVELCWNSLGDFMEECDKLPMGGNMAMLAGYSAIRSAVMGMDCMRPADDEELDAMEQMVEDCMKVGAFGLSTGRDPNYAPGHIASHEEMVRMLKVVKAHDGIFTSHTYNVSPEGEMDRMGGYREMVELAKASGVKMNVSHVHVLGMAGTPEQAVGAARNTLDYFEAVSSQGVDLSFDVLPSPYSADLTFPYFAFFIKPLVLMSGTRKQLAKNFRVPDFRKMVHLIVDNGMMPGFNIHFPGNWLGRLYINRHINESYVGKTFVDCGKLLDMAPLDALMNIFAEDPDMGANLAAFDFEEAVDILCSHPDAMPCSDGTSYPKDKNLSEEEIPLYPGEMNISFIPRYLLRQGKEDFKEAVRKASGLVAERFGIKGRGVVLTGNFADLVIMDRNELKSYDRDENPMQDPEGIEYVIVNGAIAVEHGEMAAAGAGKVLRFGH